VGNSAWRQHEQFSLQDTSLPDTTFTYAYVNCVNRPAGPRSAAGHFEGDNHFFDAAYTGGPGVTIEGFVYLFDVQQAPTLSTGNFGMHAQGTFDLGSMVTANLGGTVARQMIAPTIPSRSPLAIIAPKAGLG
jgi:hypothetical protein